MLIYKRKHTVPRPPPSPSPPQKKNQRERKTGAYLNKPVLHHYQDNPFVPIERMFHHLKYMALCVNLSESVYTQYHLVLHMQHDFLSCRGLLNYYF